MDLKYDLRLISGSQHFSQNVKSDPHFNSDFQSLTKVLRIK